MKRLLIVWHSRTGAAEAMAGAAARGAASEASVDVHLVTADLGQIEDLLGADGFIFAGPENLGALSGEMKAFLDRTYYGALDRLNGRPYAHLIAAGSDGAGAARQLARIATGWRLRRIAEPVILNTRAQTPEEILAAKHPSEADLSSATDLGAAMAAGLAMGVF